MSQPEVAVEVGALAHRENGGGGDDPVVANDEPAIVERGLWMKDRDEELGGKERIDRDAAFGKFFQGGLAFHRDERAELPVRQLVGGFGQHRDRFGILGDEGEEPMAAERRDGSSKLRLKDHEQGQGEKA